MMTHVGRDRIRMIPLIRVDAAGLGGGRDRH
jgi:hypothetical protein